MKVSFDITPRDLQAFAEHVSNASPFRRGTRLLFVTVPLVGLVVALLLRVGRLLPSLILAALLATAAARFARFASRQLLRRAIEDLIRDRGPELLGHHTVELHPDGIRETVRFRVTLDTWARFEAFDESRDHFFFWNRDLLCVVVPKRAFSSESELRAFIEEARQFWNQSD